MHNEEFAQNYAILDCSNMSPEFGGHRARGEVCTDPDAQGRDTVKEGPPRPEMSESFGCKVQRVCGGTALFRGRCERERKVDEIGSELFI